tara:strand:+ start:416 stop:598 length:183 start_codon:yes stop_codon:yes gene_type:complete
MNFWLGSMSIAVDLEMLYLLYSVALLRMLDIDFCDLAMIPSEIYDRRLGCVSSSDISSII